MFIISSDNGIDDAEVLVSLSESDLKEMGITRLGDRRKLSLEIKQLASAAAATSAEQSAPTSGLTRDEEREPIGDGKTPTSTTAATSNQSTARQFPGRERLVRLSDPDVRKTVYNN